MSAEQLLADAQAAYQLPAGHAKAQRFETLAERAKESDDRNLETQILLELSDAYSQSAEQDKQPAVFARLLWLLDHHPDAVGQLSHSIHWQLKWMTSGLLANPDVPLAVTYRWFDELERRYRQRGYSLRPVHALRSNLAANIGDAEAATALMEASIAAPRDEMTDCQACEHSGWGSLRAGLGDDGGALEHWAPVLDGTLKCREEPHYVLSKAALPLLRTGRTDEARRAFLVGYSLTRNRVKVIEAVGRHIEFCALTGNEARGLGILAEHQGWLADDQVSTSKRLGFLTGVTVLLRRLTARGHGTLPAGAGQTVASLSAVLEAEIREICGRYDARNGTSAVSDRVAARLGREPLAEQFPLGLPSRLPAVAVSPAPVVPAADASLEELIARARDLGRRRHPDTGAAWARVTAAGQELPPDVAAQAARSAAGPLLATDPAAAYPALMAASAQFAALGDLAGELEARACAAQAVHRARVASPDELAGLPDAQALADAVRDEAAAGFAAGTVTPRYYLNVVMSGQGIAAQRLEAVADRNPADIAELVAGLEAARAVAERHDDAPHAAQCSELLSRTAHWAGDRDAMVRHLTAARDSYLAADQPWFAAQPEAMLAEFALQAGDPQQAEALARDALAHAVHQPPDQIAMIATLRATALRHLPGREADFADASLTAAARWDGLSEPDTLHNTFNAARAYAGLGRDAEAAALFAEAMPKVNVPYDKIGVAQTRQAYGRSLRATGHHQEAAEQFLEAARLIADDPNNADAYASVAADAARELQEAGQDEAAVAAYQRAASLFGGRGNIVSQVRCQRSAAWIQFRLGGEARRSGVATMRSVRAWLESSVKDQPAAAELVTERDATVEQLERMLKIAAEEGTEVD